jgi:hypothetical protein
MISRHWRGVAKPECAEAYVEHLRTETLPAIAGIAGFVAASIPPGDDEKFDAPARWSPEGLRTAIRSG